MIRQSIEESMETSSRKPAPVDEENVASSSVGSVISSESNTEDMTDERRLWSTRKSLLIWLLLCFSVSNMYYVSVVSLCFAVFLIFCSLMLTSANPTLLRLAL